MTMTQQQFDALVDLIERMIVAAALDANPLVEPVVYEDAQDALTEAHAEAERLIVEPTGDDQ